MNEPSRLYVLWTNDNPVSAENMVFMYTVNALVHGWWDEVTLIVWGASAQLVSNDPSIQKLVRRALDAGVHVSACKACAEELGVTESLQKLGIEVIYWGAPLTRILKDDEKLITI